MNKFVQYSDNGGKNVLYRPSKKVEIIDIKSERIQSLIEEMKKKMKNMGIGLAANQVGEPIQIFMLEFENNTERYKGLKIEMENVPLQIFINPKIKKASKERVTFWHGCLSAINKPRGKVATYKWVDYEAFDECSNLRTGRLSGMAAIIFQHEFRHLLGKCYFDFAKEFLEIEDLQKKIKAAELKAHEEASINDPLLLSDYIVGDTIEEYTAKNYGNLKTER